MFNIAVLNALWKIVSGKRLDYEDPQLRQLDSLYTMLIEAAKITVQFSINNKKLNDIFAFLGFFDITSGLKPLGEFADQTIDDQLADFNVNDEND